MPVRHHITQLFTGQMLFLMPNQQCQSTEGKLCDKKGRKKTYATCPIAEQMVEEHAEELAKPGIGANPSTTLWSPREW